jgi:glycosyltransferase involved in cell wall biosynthesis
MVSEETGYKVEVGDITSLAERINHLCQLSFEQWQVLSKKSRERVTQLFTSDSQAKVLSNLIEDL